MKSILLAGVILFIVGVNHAIAGQNIVLHPIEKEIDGCACFVYRSSDTIRQNLVLMTDELGDSASRAWINLGRGDIELNVVSYLEDDKGIKFIFEGKGIHLKFDGIVTVPASESQEYHVLRGKLFINQGSNKMNWIVYAHSGC
jgi:hypothetical protein